MVIGIATLGAEEPPKPQTLGKKKKKSTAITKMRINWAGDQVRDPFPPFRVTIKS